MAIHSIMRADTTAITPEMARNIWRAHQLAEASTPVVPTGFPGLDRVLPGGGWPQSTLIDIAAEQTGCGEMQLLRPALSRLAFKEKRQKQARQHENTCRLALVAPPFLPNAALLSQWNITSDQLFVVQARQTNDRFWAALQILRHDTCHGLLIWHDGKVSTAALRQLHLAAQSSHSLLWLLRPAHSILHSSPAPLRLVVSPTSHGIEISVAKRRGVPLAEPVRLVLPGWPPLPSRNRASASPEGTTQSITASISAVAQLYDPARDQVT